MRRVVTVLAVLGLVAGAGYWLGNRPAADLPSFGPECTVEADGQVRLDTDQMANAATITAVGARRGLPDRAVVVALATALQESKLRNLPHLGANNDHDSVGLFQQRPSQGWGTPEQISDPRYAAERFYRALNSIPGWQDMRLTDAAQRVQRSAHPEAYAKWAGDATVLAAALLGQAGAAVACTVRNGPRVTGQDAAAALGTELARDWGAEATVSGPEPAGLSVTTDDPRTGWRYAHWLVSHAAGHGVARVQFADLEWTAEQGIWAPVDSATGQVLAEVYTRA